MQRTHTVVELGPGRLRAVSAVSTSAGLRVTAVLHASRPDVGGDLDEAGFVQWMQKELDRHGIAKGGCTVAVPRGDAVIKQLSFPTHDEGEVAGMVRFAMAEELHLDEQDVRIDFLPSRATPEGMDVLAAALPESSLERAQRRLRTLSRPARCMSLRFLGAALLVGDRGRGTTACIDVTGDGVEFTLVQGEYVKSVRGVALPQGPVADVAQAVVTETKRTWMSWQADPETGPIDQVILLGEPEITEASKDQLADSVGAPIRLLTSHSSIDAGGHNVSGLWPLVGLLLRQRQRQPVMDFMQTRQPPDKAAQRRMMVLGALGSLAIVLALIWTIGSMSTRGMRLQLEQLTRDANRLEAPWLRYHRDRYRLAHLQLWESQMPQWHLSLADVIERLNPPGSLVVDDITGVFDWKGVDAPREGGLDEWTVKSSRQLTLEAEAASREVGESFRESWVDDPDWEVATAGADKQDGDRLPFGLTIKLATSANSDASETSSESSP
ncbi:MAG: hypothetical protein MK077_05965 [Phycisphaerales bacterium]|nr:hypothetical protein [Phycisphaerales bacterium]